MGAVSRPVGGRPDTWRGPAKTLWNLFPTGRFWARNCQTSLLELVHDQHPVESILEAAVWPGGEQGTPVAGPGAPLVAEFCIAEFALAIGVSTDAGRALIGEALELKYRLRRLWTRVRTGDLPAWKARRRGSWRSRSEPATPPSPTRETQPPWSPPDQPPAMPAPPNPSQPLANRHVLA